MAAAPWLPELLRTRGPRRLAFGLAVLLAALAALGAAYFAFDAGAAERIVRDFGIHPVLPLVVAAVAAAIPVAWLRPRDGWLAYAGALVAMLVTIGILINPRIDPMRSGRAFMSRVEQASRDVTELGLVGFREQYLLQLRRPSVNFGHARWRERAAEAADAAAWLAARPGRALLVESEARDACFGAAPAVELGRANRAQWTLVSGVPDAACVARGDRSRALLYSPPDARLDTGG
jgi:hypothetical protein